MAGNVAETVVKKAKSVSLSDHGESVKMDFGHCEVLNVRKYGFVCLKKVFCLRNLDLNFMVSRRDLMIYYP